MSHITRSRLPSTAFLKQLTTGLPMSIRQVTPAAPVPAYGVYADTALQPGDVLFTERAAATALGSERVARAHCAACRAPQQRVRLESVTRGTLEPKYVHTLEREMTERLQLQHIDQATSILAECNKCDEVLCNGCAGADAPHDGCSVGAPALDRLRSLIQVGSDQECIEAERALLALAVFERVRRVNERLGAPVVQLPERLDVMCFDNTITWIDPVADALAKVVRNQEEMSLLTRIAGITRSNGFRVAASQYEVRVEKHALVNRQKHWPPDAEDITTTPVDAVPFISLFTLACYFNHSCVPNVVPLSVSLNGSSVRGDEFAFVVVRNVDVGGELCVEYTSTGVHKTPADRRAHLQRVYGFECNCSLCQSGK
eukprot:TRINITY_DN2841_c0_g1_i1.p1 TRINITY_DN2841_c0_g1~~TRINITY_DN2841_c0_g1_i1.p1  ORF type:complete len:371 (-),score=78.56 TRINITY_DN2841_c0_g1_i1:28-1140(-)